MFLIIFSFFSSAPFWKSLMVHNLGGSFFWNVGREPCGVSLVYTNVKGHSSIDSMLTL